MPRTAYGPDLAFVHDAGYSDFAHGAAPGLLALLRRGGIACGFVVELGCRSGAAPVNGRSSGARAPRRQPDSAAQSP